MKVLKVFVLGLLYGWLVKFTIDRIYRDNKIADNTKENIFLKEHIRSLETALQPKSLEAQSVSRPVTQPVEQSGPVQTGTRKDDLKRIKGVGPAIEKRLNNAGIYTFAEIAQLTPEELQERLGNTKLISISTGNLIAQATKLARQK